MPECNPTDACKLATYLKLEVPINYRRIPIIGVPSWRRQHVLLKRRFTPTS